MAFIALSNVGVVYLDQSMNSGDVAATSEVDDVLMWGVDRELGAIVSNTRKVGAEERQHNGHGGLGEDLVVALADKVGAEDHEDSSEIHDLTAPGLPKFLECYDDE